MAMYYVMDFDIPEDDDGGYLEVDDGLEFEGFESWTLGRRWNAKLPNPIVVEVEPIDGYVGRPPELYSANMCLMSDELVAALKDAGVDNLDCYPAILQNTETGEKYRYQAVNIIGVQKAADLTASQWESHDGDGLFDVKFEGLAINEAAAGGHLLFRLAESTGTIMVHHTVKEKLDKGKFPSLRFIEPKDWIT